ncbi:hypothetical protein [Sulfuriferula thiophila]|uniref:hypothetical protein n=1 Tax=Sulfuriferula thiophila TaxID=1781211 RepID=UPI0016787F73|nr:hypothetical protein [Sulfuriferula thiophila]
MLYKSFIATSLFLLALFSYAQYHGWSVWGVNEAKHGSGSGGHGGTGRSIYHK